MRVWLAFSDLHRSRPGEWIARALPYSEIDAWSRVTGTVLDAWELDALRAVDDAFLEIIAKDQQQSKGPPPHG